MLNRLAPPAGGATVTTLSGTGGLHFVATSGYFLSTLIGLKKLPVHDVRGRNSLWNPSGIGPPACRRAGASCPAVSPAYLAIRSHHNQGGANPGGEAPPSTAGETPPGRLPGRPALRSLLDRRLSVVVSRCIPI